jgi:hypothetical protein
MGRRAGFIPRQDPNCHRGSFQKAGLWGQVRAPQNELLFDRTLPLAFTGAPAKNGALA